MALNVFVVPRGAAKESAMLNDKFKQLLDFVH